VVPVEEAILVFSNNVVFSCELHDTIIDFGDVIIDVLDAVKVDFCVVA